MSVESGELALRVVADTTGLAAELRGKLGALKKTDITVGVKINTTQLRAALRTASRGVTVTVTPTINKTALRAALAEATRSVTVTVTPKVDTAKMRAALLAASRDITVNARVDFDRATIQAQWEAATAGLRINPIVDIDRNKLFHDVRNAIVLAMQNLPPIPIPTPPPGGGGGGAGGAGGLGNAANSGRGLIRILGSVSRAATIAVGALALFEGAGAAILGVVGALGAVVGGLFAITAASASAVGALAVIPAAVGGLVQVAATAIAGFKGVGAAVQGLTESQQGAAKAATDTAKTQRAAARSVEAAQKSLRSAYEQVETSQRGVVDAQRGVRDAIEGVAAAQKQSRNTAEALARAQETLASAYEGVDDAAQQAADGISAAESRNVRAQTAARSAQDKLNDSREEAVRKLRDYQSQLDNAALDEESATLAVERARARLNEVNTTPSASNLDRREADLGLRQAEQGLRDLQQSNKDLAQEANNARKAGVEGTDAVISAREGLVSANDEVVDSEKARSQAYEDAAQVQKDAASTLVEAQRGVRDAYEASADAAKGIRDANEAVMDAYDGVTQAQKGVVRAAEGVTEAQENLRDAQLDAADAIKNTASTLSKAQKAFDNASPSAQNFARFLVNEFIPVLKRVQTAVQDTLLPKMEEALRNLIPLEGPVTAALGAMAGALGDASIKFSEMVTSPAWTKDIQQGGIDNARQVTKLTDSIFDLLDVFRNITVAAQPMIDRFTDYLNVVTGGWKETAEMNRENGKLEEFFKRTGDTIAQWSRIIGNVTEAIGNLGTSADDAGHSLLDSLEGSTEDFVKWTEDNAGDIKEYFNAIVPVVRSVGRILVNVLKTFARISGDPATARMIDIIEKRVGPALERLIDDLLDSGSGETFLLILEDLIDLLDGIVKSGALTTVIGWIEDLTDSLGKFAQTKDGQDQLGTLIKVAAIAGPLGLVASGALTLYGALSKITGLPSVGTLLGRLPSLVRNAARALAKGGAVGLIAGAAGTIAGNAVSDDQNGGRDIGGAALAGAGQGAAIGAVLGSVVPGAGTAVGAAGGAVIGGGLAALDEKAKQDGGYDKLMENIFNSIDSWADPINDSVNGWLDNLTGKNRETGEGGGFGGLAQHAYDEIDAWAKPINDSVNGWFDKLTGKNRETGEGGGVGGLAKNAWQAVDKWSMPINDAVNGWLDNAKKKVGDFFGGIGNWISEKKDLVKQKFVEIGGEIIAGLVESFNDPDSKLGAVLRFFDRAVEVVKGLLGIQSPSTVFKEIGQNIIDGLFEPFSNIADKARGFFDKVVTEAKALPGKIMDALSGLKSSWTGFWTDRREDANTKVGEARDRVRDRVSEIQGKIQPKLNELSSGWSSFWAGRRDDANTKASETGDRVRDRVNDIRGKLGQVFPALQGVWDNFWKGLKSAAAGPINFVINNIINGGIGNAWKAVDKFLNGALPDWTPVPAAAFATGGVLPGYTPGKDVHQFTSPTGGRLALSGGEAIMRPEWTRAVGGPKAVDQMNDLARRGQSAFAQGGVFGGAVQKFANGGVAAVLDFGRWLRTKGYDVGENRALGDNPRPGVHSAKGYHYKDDNSGAIDVNKGAGTSLSEQMELAKAVNSARTRGLRSYFFASDGSHRDHAHFDYGSGDNVQKSRMPKAVADLRSGNRSSCWRSVARSAQ